MCNQVFTYIYHFNRPLGQPQSLEKRQLHSLPPAKNSYTKPHARHYTGSTVDLYGRDWQHRHGQGSKLLAAASLQGIPFQIVRVWAGPDRKVEQLLKSYHNTPLFCPICNQNPYRIAWAEEIDVNEALLSPWNDQLKETTDYLPF